uniref:Uncharacterized protein n=1 Tax=Clytia hemisphaerica TaxID=252671 RepID=A0A7M5XNA1_9CNID
NVMIPTTIKYKILVVIIVVLCVCVLKCDGMPNGTITKHPQSTNKPTSQPNEDKTKWWKWLALPGAFAACIVIFKFVLDCFTWRKYEKANEIALNFMKTNKENYGIDYSSWLKIECCWSCCLSCSAVWFTQGCCRQKPAEKGVSYNNGRGDGAATETTHLISHSSSVVDVGPSMAPSMNIETGPSTDGEGNTQVVESFSSRNNGMDDNNAGYIEKKEGSVVTLAKIQFVDERLVKPVGINTKPTDAWSLISDTHKLPEEGIEAFKNMIGRCTIITFHQFLKHCLRYGGFLRPLNRRSHFYHFGGKKSGLEFYQTYHKLALHPVLYYVALDWYHFKT